MQSMIEAIEVVDDRVVEILRKKTPAERLAIADGLWTFARQVIGRIVAREQPDWSEDQVRAKSPGGCRMGPSDLLRRFVAVLERLNLPYLITGSMATIAYGEPRFTNDIDVVVALPADCVDDFCASFPEDEYYCYREAVVQAVRDHFQFNIIHFESGLKFDVIVPDASDFNRSRLARGVRLPAGNDFDAWFASPEDVIIKKLEFFRAGGSEKHIRDIIGVLKMDPGRIDREYMSAWTNRLGLADIWQDVVRRAGST